MIEFKKIDNCVILIYTGRSPNIDWVYEDLDRFEAVKISKTFTFKKDDIVEKLSDD
ncbi:MAG: hypothetical protein GY756_05325, partial [bacterium]|nr:hypothetical protein [bacterium]